MGHLLASNGELLRSIELPLPIECCVALGANLYCGTRSGAIVCVEGASLTASICVPNVGFPIFCMTAIEKEPRRQVVVGGEAKTIQVWDVVSGVHVLSLAVSGHVIAVASVLSPSSVDGKKEISLLSCATKDGDVFFYG